MSYKSERDGSENNSTTSIWAILAIVTFLNLQLLIDLLYLFFLETSDQGRCLQVMISINIPVLHMSLGHRRTLTYDIQKRTFLKSYIYLGEQCSIQEDASV